MFRRYTLLLLLLYTTLVFGQNTETVKAFGDNLKSWAQTDEAVYYLRAENNCGGKKKTIVSNNIAMSLAKKNGEQGNKSYRLDKYLSWLQKEIDNKINIQFSNIVPVNAYDIDGDIPSGYGLVACRVEISGASDFDEMNLFYLENGKIVKIDDYIESVDKRTGRRRIHVDFSDLYYDQAAGITYNYSKHFPIGASLIYSYQKFMCSLDFGITSDKYSVNSKTYDMTNIMNYTITESTFKPKCFITLTPGFYLKYFSVGCGFGAAVFSGDITSTSASAKISTSGNTTSFSYSTGTTHTSSGEIKYNFMLRPVVRGFIPCNDEWSIALSVGYDLVAGIKELSGVNFGLGVIYSFD